MNSLGERLKAARIAQGWTQERLAAGVATKGFISQVEHNQTTPSLPRLRLLAERLGRPISYFLDSAPPADAEYLMKAAELAIKAGEAKRALALLDEIAEHELAADERANSRRLRGVALRAAGRLSQGLRTLQEAAALAPADHPAVGAAIYAEIGAALGEQELFNPSVEASLRALQWLEGSRHPDLDVKARVLTNIAKCWYALGRTAEAATYFEEALAVATDGEILVRMAKAHMALGITARAMGQLPAAKQHCDQALALHKRLGQERVANEILNNLGDVYYAQGNVEEARRLQRQCLERGRERKEYLAVAAAASELARYALDEGQLSEAIDLSGEARQAAERAGSHVFEARALALEGMAADRQGRHAAGDGAFRRAFDILRAREALAEMAETCARYSNVLRERGDTAGAFAFLQMAYARQFDGLIAALRAARRNAYGGRTRA
ncbi:MAG TPA: helix-turn-helix transcriptional regulator [Candidatus Dormibacteraeota bacterium]|jgi:tetratricopeptide (TPR) repeat protein|nr:helix-turn-helix transcriptional regulator [Candidatus Dormibacteraeota bacterium]